MEKLTPMIRQYLEIKKNFENAILLFRLGDFYEMFMDDAQLASKVLNITLTSRNNVPMCGVPYHAASTYIKRLLDAGYKVAICEQVEDPKLAKGIVKREVVRILTPGTYIESEEESAQAEYIASVAIWKKTWGLSLCNINTAELYIYEGSKEEILDILQKEEPKTVLIPEEKHELKKEIQSLFIDTFDDWLVDLKTARDIVREHFGKEPEGMGIIDKTASLIALSALLYYLREIQLCNIEHLNKVEFYKPEEKLYLDPNTIRHLELVRNLRGEEQHTLFSVMDRTLTPMGKRLLRKELTSPLLVKNEIEERLNAVQELVESGDYSEFLKNVPDLERIVSRIKTTLAKPRELIALKEALHKLKSASIKLQNAQSPLLKNIADKIKPEEKVIILIENTLENDPDATGSIIKTGVNQELDELKRIRENADLWLKEYEEREKRLTGIPSLKIRYNKVFGYYIEVTKTHIKNVPEHYIRKQTLTNAERYITEELKQMEEKILTSQEKISQIEDKIYKELLSKLATYSESIKENAKATALLDLINSFAILSREKGYTKPKIVEDGRIVIIRGKHPVIEDILGNEFIPNDTVLLQETPIHIITGPNMSGKSTYIRQVALIVLMAQMGCFVPAEKAMITPVDKILTRVGTADHIASGQSTFMVEMTETANILNNATKRSLIILDEVGRGTSTYDGLAIAWACVEYIKDNIKAKTLFATHYHELTELADIYPEIQNWHVEVKEWKDRVIFTHKVKQGRTNKSYGIYVAKLAGLPEKVIERAKEILQKLEEKETPAQMLPLYEHPAILKLKSLNIEKLTPLEAMILLEELKNLVE